MSCQEWTYTDKRQTCITFGANREVFSLTLIQVDTPFYKGEVQCCVVDKPVCDLILDNYLVFWMNLGC